MDNDLYYFAIDGDEIGKRHAKAILDDDVNEISNISEAITAANEMVDHFFESRGGKKISLGGDEGLFEAPADVIPLLEQLRKDYLYMVNATLSIGVGKKPSEAGKALIQAKGTGKDKVVEYSEETEKYIDEFQNKDESENQKEHKKIAAVLDSNDHKSDSANQNSGMDNDVGHDKVLPPNSDIAQNEPTLCEPPKYDNNHGYDSGYKNDDEQQREDSYRDEDLTPPTIIKPNLEPKRKVMEAVSTDIQESTRPMNMDLPDPEDKEPMDKKPAPKEYHGQAEGDAPESMAQPKESKPGDLKYFSGEQNTPNPDVPIENATSDKAMETEQKDMADSKHCASCTCAEHKQLAENTLNQHVENAKDFQDSLNSNSEDESPENSSDDALDTHVENAIDFNQSMDDNGISRPLDYGQKDEDMGLSEEESENNDEPNLDEVLKEGLDQHASNIKKEKTMDLVGQALEGFKSQKHILDKAKEQAPELYDSCISMLKAMIQLCDLAGINSDNEKDMEQIESGEEKVCEHCGHLQSVHPEGTAPFPKE